jgi:hypothetical protein
VQSVAPGTFQWVWADGESPATTTNYAAMLVVTSPTTAGLEFYVREMSAGPLGTLTVFTGTMATPGSATVEGWTSPLWATDSQEYPADISVALEQIRVFGAGAAVAATVAAPTQYDTLSGLFYLPEGTWVVEWQFTLSGTVAGSETASVGLYTTPPGGGSGTPVMNASNAAAAGTYGPYYATVTMPSGGGLVELLMNNAGSTGTYACQFNNPQALSVLRSVNGVAQSSGSGTDVRLFREPIVAMQ